MKTIHVLASLGFAALAGTAVASAPSSFNESRGYQNCVAAADAAAAENGAPILRVDSTYYIRDRHDSRIFYLNAYARSDGRTEPLRVACETNRNGSRLLTVNVEAGHYVGRTAGTDLAVN